MNGQCMCGAVKFRAEIGDKFAACFCEMCQRWASGMFNGVGTTAFEVTDGEEYLTVFKSSDWANRAFCNKCGSNIYYHMPEHGTPSVALGTLENTDELRNAIRFFVDKRPKGLRLAGEAKELTEAECMAMFGDDE